MTDRSVLKVDSQYAPVGPEGQHYLVSGKQLSMRLWRCSPREEGSVERTRNYETVGYVIRGKAKLTMGETVLELVPGDSWLVPAGVEHFYTILEPLTAVEATCPPANEEMRDDQP